MIKLLKTTSLVAAGLVLPTVASAQPYYNSGSSQNPHEACKSDEDDRQVLGGIIGAIAGGVIGSQVAGDGARSEGTAVGAVIGGLAGAGIADQSIDCDPTYPETRRASYETHDYGHQTHHEAYEEPVVYRDRVTYSNHPVYDNPTYGAGGVSEGTTYEVENVTYPATTTRTTTTTTTTRTTPVYTETIYGDRHDDRDYNHNHDYRGSDYKRPTYHQVSYPYRTRPRTNTYRTPRPVYGVRQIASGPRHYHGRHICTAYH